MDGAVAAAGNNGIATPAHSLFRMSLGAFRRAALKDLGRNPGRAQHIKRTFNGCLPAR